MSRLKETPGGAPLTTGRRFGAAAGLSTAMFLFSFVPICLNSADLYIRKYPLLKVLSLILPKQRVTVRFIESQTAVLWYAAACALPAVIVGIIVWRTSNPKSRKLVVERGQSANSAALARRLKHTD